MQRLTVQGREIPREVEATILNNHFDFEDFKTQIIGDAKNTVLIKEIINNYIEPPPRPALDAPPYLKEETMCELIFKIASAGEIVINANGTWAGRKADDASDENSYHRLRQALYKTVNEMKNYQLALPEAAGSATPIAPVLSSGSALQPQQPVPPANTSDILGTTEENIKEPTPNFSTVPSAQHIPVPPVPAMKIKLAGPANSINLMGEMENWNLSSSLPVHKFNLEFTDIDIAKVKQILQRVPSGFQPTMSISHESEEEKS